MPNVYSKPFPLSGLTYGHLFTGLKEEHNVTPLSTDYKDRVIAWVKKYVFHNQSMSPEEEKSVEEFSTYFHDKAKVKWRATRSQLRPGYSAAVDTWLNIKIPTSPSMCNCSRCSAVRARTALADFSTAAASVSESATPMEPSAEPSESALPTEDVEMRDLEDEVKKKKKRLFCCTLCTLT